MIAETIYIMPPSAGGGGGGGGGGARAATEVTEKFALDSSDASADKANNNNHNRGGSFFKRNFSHLSNQGPKFISLLYTHTYVYGGGKALGRRWLEKPVTRIGLKGHVTAAAHNQPTGRPE